MDVLYYFDLQVSYSHCGTSETSTVQSQVDPSPHAMLILATVWKALGPNLNSCKNTTHDESIMF